jgi:ADP-ribosyl-[dinitrogen reductase] hydrolase
MGLLRRDGISDRAAGVLLGGAVGDALGVPYEFATPPAVGVVPVMSGGGLGDYAPGEWSDDTQMACCVAEVLADGGDLCSPEGLEREGYRFMDWLDLPPADIGVQTSTVLRLARVDRLRTGGAFVPFERFFEHSVAYAANHEHAAGNGALMRTGPVALGSLQDQVRTATAARLVARLTHADPLAGDSCVLWSEAIRVAVTEERFNFTAGLDLLPVERQPQWSAWIGEAMAPDAGPVPGARFRPNGFTVTALQAAIAAIHHTPIPERRPDQHLADALCNAARIGDDTDTIAAIAGALLGARWGASAVPKEWAKAVHGWPDYTARDLQKIAGHVLAGSR